ncbi:MAG: hypothetical protein EOP21_10210 [Hyphomicrobiales bacterium]|nr:MAG: hypothetical protein EOP21_10210 [Hyphomicrobiales bacterium]
MNRKREEMPDLTETARLDPVEQAGLDSFPASDPPSWTSIGIGGPARSDADDDMSLSEHSMTNRLHRGTSG